MSNKIFFKFILIPIIQRGAVNSLSIATFKNKADESSNKKPDLIWECGNWLIQSKQVINWCKSIES